MNYDIYKRCRNSGQLELLRCFYRLYVICIWMLIVVGIKTIADISVNENERIWIVIRSTCRQNRKGDAVKDNATRWESVHQRDTILGESKPE